MCHGKICFYFAGDSRLNPQWCQLAYWEECNRVGRLYPVSASHIEVFSFLPKGRHEDSGLCLATLFKQNKSPSESTAKTREKIGQGMAEIGHKEGTFYLIVLQCILQVFF